MSRFEKADTVRYPIPGSDDFIEVRRRLSGAERRKMSASAFRDLGQGHDDKPIVGVDFAALGLAKVKAYLVSWGGPGFLDPDGRALVPCTPEAIDALSEETLKVVEKIINDHTKRIDDESKVPSGVPASSPV